MLVPPRREIEAEERLLREPLYNDLRPQVTDLVARLHRAETVEDWVQLHRDLLIQFGGRQDAADKAIPAAKNKVAAEMAELARQEPKPTDELRERQQILDRIKMQELVARASQHTLRQIGDGIAWRALHMPMRPPVRVPMRPASVPMEERCIRAVPHAQTLAATKD